MSAKPIRKPLPFDTIVLTHWVWTTKLPTKVGRYFYRESLDHKESIVKVFKVKGEKELSVRYRSGEDGINWLINYEGRGQWCGPIPLPIENLLEDHVGGGADEVTWTKDQNGKVVLKRGNKIIGLQG